MLKENYKKVAIIDTNIEFTISKSEQSKWKTVEIPVNLNFFPSIVIATHYTTHQFGDSFRTNVIYPFNKDEQTKVWGNFNNLYIESVSKSKIIIKLYQFAGDERNKLKFNKIIAIE